MRAPTHVVAAVLAGGTGSRMAHVLPKQLLQVAGRTVLEHTVKVFQQAPDIDEIVVLMQPDHLAQAEAIGAGYPKVTRVLPGGSSRTGSTQVALRALAEAGHPDCAVVFHDAVRPLVDQRIVSDVVRALATHEAVAVAVATSDTILAVDHGVVVGIPDRAHLRRAQTPQAFHLATITAAYEKAQEDPQFAATDDCAVVLRYLPEVPIVVVEGSEQNLKITHPTDLAIVERLLRQGPGR